MENSEIQWVPLSCLYLSPNNPRQVCSDAEIEALALSVKTIGLLQNLIGLKEANGQVSILGGGRRLRALQRIAVEEGDDHDPLIPVKIAEDRQLALAWANAENNARAALNPADEVKAYGEMIDVGMTPEMVARSFAVSLRHVKGRLKLARVADPILEGLRAGEVTLEAAAAYTVADDAETQAALFTRLRGQQWNRNDPAYIRRMLKPMATTNQNLIQFVGREYYEKAGGSVSENLFGDEVYFNDTEILQNLAEQKLLEMGREMQKAEGWKWFEVFPEGNTYPHLQSMTRLPGKKAILTPEEANRYDELSDMIESDAATDEEKAEFDMLDERMESTMWTAEEASVCGVVLALERGGAPSIYRGLMRAADRTAAVEIGVVEVEAPKSLKEEKLYSAALQEDLEAIRTGAIQTALLRKPELLLDLLAFALSQPSHGGFPLAVRVDASKNLPQIGQDAVMIPERLTPHQRSGFYRDTNSAEAFSSFRAKPKKERNAILAEELARAFRGRLKLIPDAMIEQISDLSGADVREIWTPDQAFFIRLSKAQLVAIEHEIMGRESEQVRKMSKADLAKALDAMFNTREHSPMLTPEQSARAAMWRPLGM